MTKKEMILKPIGIVHSELKLPIHQPGKDIDPGEKIKQIRDHHHQVKKSVSVIEIDPAYEELLEGIDDFSHILILYWPHLIPDDERNISQVHPMGRKDLPKQGIFATRSPVRPNPVLVSSVKLLERKKKRLKVQGLEAIDQSPVIDIKPVVRERYSMENLKFPEWLLQAHKELEMD